MNIFTFWQNESAVSSVPPYILLSLATMRLNLGDSFLLLTPRNIHKYVPRHLIDKRWQFAHKSGHLSAELMHIVATSDFLRMYMVAEHGGVWIDADTIVLSDFRDELSNLLRDRLLFHSEQFFCSQRDNTLLLQVVENMITADRLIWGNPGSIHDIVKANKEQVDFIPMTFFDPGYTPTYNASCYDVILRHDVSVESFRHNPKQRIQKLYNSQFVKFIPREQPISDFISSGMLLARIFLAQRSDPSFWIHEGARIYDEVTGKI
jgi:hypothetical protein